MLIQYWIADHHGKNGHYDAVQAPDAAKARQRIEQQYPGCVVVMGRVKPDVRKAEAQEAELVRLAHGELTLRQLMEGQYEQIR